MISVPIVPVEPAPELDSFDFVEPQIPQEEELHPEPHAEATATGARTRAAARSLLPRLPAPVVQPQTRWSYVDLFLDTRNCAGLMQKMEQQAEHGDPAIALATARTLTTLFFTRCSPNLWRLIARRHRKSWCSM